ncbi:MAG: hypothetical protein GF344_08320 [Chitinivibrionales bacterium]|nr:hypothetical protein [Chitinivibrionales bacterium]MBD3356881.1 hypothetical protein [Chitinivibrionales bacterium]
MFLGLGIAYRTGLRATLHRFHSQLAVFLDILDDIRLWIIVDLRHDFDPAAVRKRVRAKIPRRGAYVRQATQRTRSSKGRPLRQPRNARAD